MKYNSNTEEIYGKPVVEDIGYYLVEITALDFEKSVSDYFVVIVSNYGPYLMDSEALHL